MKNPIGKTLTLLYTQLQLYRSESYSGRS